MTYNYGYQPVYQPNVYSNALPTQQNALPTQTNAQPQIHNGGFISIPSEEMVNTYPVAPGNCVTFKIEGKPIVMEKSMGFSQFESPKIDRYRLVKEDVEVEEVKETVDDYDEIKTSISELWGAIDDIRSNMEKPATEKTTTARRRKDGDD